VFPSNCRNKGETFLLALVSQTGEVIGAQHNVLQTATRVRTKPPLSVSANGFQ
jgi:hypothetical protein